MRLTNTQAGLELEKNTTNSSRGDLGGTINDVIIEERRPRLPSFYEQSSEDLHLDAFQDSATGGELSNSKFSDS